MTTVASPTPIDEAARRAWRTSNRPIVVALVAVVLVAAAGWGLRWWGPINPEVVVENLGPTTGDGTVAIWVTNASRSPITIESVDLRLAGASPEGPIETESDPVPGPERLAVPVAPGDDVTLAVRPPVCSDRSLPTYRASVTVRSSIGRVFRVEEPTSSAVPCRPALPEPGLQPDDPAAARTAVVAAFGVAHDGSRSGADREAVVDDPSGLDLAYRAALDGPLGAIVPMVGVDVVDVVFDRPDHAWVSYTYTPPAPPGQTIGEANLVDGTWKVARSTICADLALVDVSCPR